MGLFFTAKKVSAQDFKNVRSMLLSKGLSHREIEEVAMLAQGALDEIGRERGMDRREIEQLCHTLRTNREAHSLADHQIDIVEEVLKKKL